MTTSALWDVPEACGCVLSRTEGHRCEVPFGDEIEPGDLTTMAIAGYGERRRAPGTRSGRESPQPEKILAENTAFTLGGGPRSFRSSLMAEASR